MVAPILAGIHSLKKYRPAVNDIAKTLYDPEYKTLATDYVTNIVLHAILAAFDAHNHYSKIHCDKSIIIVNVPENNDIQIQQTSVIKTCGYIFELSPNKLRSRNVDINISRMYYAGESSKLISETGLRFMENSVCEINEIAVFIYKKIYNLIDYKLKKSNDETLKSLGAMQDYANTMKVIKSTLNDSDSEQEKIIEEDKTVETTEQKPTMPDKNKKSIPTNGIMIGDKIYAVNFHGVLPLRYPTLDSLIANLKITPIPTEDTKNDIDARSEPTPDEPKTSNADLIRLNIMLGRAGVEGPVMFQMNNVNKY